MTLCEQVHAETKCSGGILDDPVTSSKDLHIYEWPKTANLVWGHDEFLPAWPVDQNNSATPTTNLSHGPQTEGLFWLAKNALMCLQLSVRELVSSSETFWISFMSKVDKLMKETNQPEDVDYVSPMMDDIALSLTNKIRTVNTTFTVQGTARAPVTFVSVNWYWLSFLVVLVVFGILFFFATMVLSSRRDNVLWKTSILPFVFHDLTITKEDRSEQSLRNLAEAAAMHAVVLEEQRDGGMTLKTSVEDSMSLKEGQVQEREVGESESESDCGSSRSGRHKWWDDWRWKS
jgi:hypothetical protein